MCAIMCCGRDEIARVRLVRGNVRAMLRLDHYEGTFRPLEGILVALLCEEVQGSALFVGAAHQILAFVGVGFF